MGHPGHPQCGSDLSLTTAAVGDVPAPRIRHLRRLKDIAASDWDRQFDGAYPFTRYAWLSRLEQHDCVSEREGWEARHLIAEDAAGTCVGAAPLYLKHHSYGEFVFDFAWAEASHRIGQPYYPKYLSAIPYVPSTGQRLGAGDGAVRRELATHLAALGEREGRSSAHALFVDERDAPSFREAGFIERHDVQFQWHNRGYIDMAAFLATFNSDKRKKFLRERRRVTEAGITFEVCRGRDLPAQDWDLVYRLYANTYHERGQHPYFTRDFLSDVGTAEDLDLRLVFAVHEHRRVAMAILLVGGDTLYGRHWGAEAHYHSLHFECCYHQGIELCLREGLGHFDAGTQGMHKLGRGFDPVATRSFHYLTDPRLREAVKDYLARERRAVAARVDELMHHRPYRSSTDAPVTQQGSGKE